MAARRAWPRARSRAGCQQPAGAAGGCPCRSGRCPAATTAWARPRRAGSAPAPGCAAWLRAGRSARRCAHHRSAVHVGERPALRVLGIGQQRGGGGVGQGRSWRPRPARLAACSCSSSLRWPSAASNCQAGRSVSGSGAARRPQARSSAGVTPGAEQQLAGAMRATQPQLVGGALGQVQLALRHAQPGQAQRVARPWCTASSRTRPCRPAARCRSACRA
jgi:hypothetical protein